MFFAGLFVLYQGLLGFIPAHEQMKTGKTPAVAERTIRYQNGIIKMSSWPGRQVAYIPGHIRFWFTSPTDEMEKIVNAPESNDQFLNNGEFGKDQWNAPSFGRHEDENLQWKDTVLPPYEENVQQEPD